MARKLPYILILKVPADVDRSEFEPTAHWTVMPNGRLMVTQEVFKDGGILIGATETFWESLSDIVSDVDRFGGLLPNAQA